MTSLGQDQQRRPADSSHVESLHDPVREPDMQQSEQTFRFRLRCSGPTSPTATMC